MSSLIIKGSLDVITPDHASGWAYSPQAIDGIVVQALLSTEVVGEFVANLFRQDLGAAGFGDGKCGYNITFYRRIDLTYLPFVVIKPEGCDVALPRWHPTGLTEYFSAAFRFYPATGRHRSVFGGLWIDRLDAAAMVRGKFDIKQITKSDVDVLTSLIHDGLAVINGLPALTQAPAADAGNVGALLTAGLVQVLQAILEDRPVVLKADVLAESQPLEQPSTRGELPGQNECLVVLAPLGAAPLQVETVRDSHRLPEFNRNGKSRWLDATTVAATASGLRSAGLLDRYEISPGSAVLIGPGTLHVVRIEEGERALRLVVVPGRGVPAHILDDPSRKETIVANDIHAWL